MRYLNRRYWTSDLIIYSDVEFKVSEIEDRLNAISSTCSQFSGDDIDSFDAWLYIRTNTKMDFEYYTKITTYDTDLLSDFDATCMLKGFALLEIHRYLLSEKSSSHLISFGGDILGYNTSARINIEDTNFYINKIKKSFCIFTSGNSKKRGNHIKMNGFSYDLSGETITTVWDDIDDPIMYDALTTRLYAGHLDELADYWGKFKLYTIDNHKLMHKVYCASPFFNDTEIGIRDRMVSKFTDVFRPDQTKSSKSYNTSPGKSLASSIYNDNIYYLKDCDLLVFPEGTGDIGTLYELGYFTGLGKNVIRYNDKNNTYDIVDMDVITKQLKIDVKTKSIVDCSNVVGAVLTGYLDSQNIPFYYYTGNLNDNIMLNIRHKRVDKDGIVLPPKWEIGM